ncbi:transglutaminase-like domain-containing protein [Dethiobacter alkaliphilus]|uniref:transglutaminase-like domain-containing protein n=1 Tax=Dethiobacter alkaliphilus TaxID=427926 RepID=UPI002227BD49|nr:transglutaminase-like domain-containing protein [Dethiobacter alkaliphilus]MCW3489286.1 transglutaminase-like domain-containing protein [Dethiobacter alkaliphilus]
MKKGFSKFLVYVAVVFLFASSSFAMHQLSPFGGEREPEAVLASADASYKPEEQAPPVPPAPTAATELPPSQQITRDDIDEEEQKEEEQQVQEEQQDEATEENNPAQRSATASANTETSSSNNAISQQSGTTTSSRNNTSSQSNTTTSSERREDKPQTEEEPAAQSSSPTSAEETKPEPKPEPVEEKNTPANPYRISSSRDHRYMTKIEVKNTSDKEARHVRIEVPLISSSSLYQSRRSESFSIEPSEIKTVSGTRVAVFSLGTIEPGEDVVVEAKAVVRTSNIEFFADYVPKDSSKSSSYLGASSGIESTNSQIVNLSNQITSGLSSDWEKAQAITRWVTNNISYDASAENRNSGALQALQSRRGVCEDYAMLAAALARAAGIPTRIAYGYADNRNSWSGSMSLSGYRHAWVEYSLEGRGWVPAEPTRSNSSNLFFGRLPSNRYIIQNYSNISLKGSYSGGQLSINWSDSLY